MIIFVVLLLLTIYLCQQSYVRQKKSLLYIIVIMMLLCGLRASTVGADTHNYIDFALGSIDSEHFSFIFESFRTISDILGGHENIFLMILSIFTYAPLYFIIKKEAPLPMLAVLVYMVASTGFFLETFNIARQSIAIIFLLYSFCFFMRKNYMGTFASFLCAVIFHSSSLIVAPFYLLNNVKIPNFKVCIVILIISVLIGFSDITSFIAEVLNTLMMFSDISSNFGAFSRYADREINLDWNFVGKLSHCLPITLLTILSYSKASSQSFLFKMMFVGTIILNLMLTNRFCERFASMFLISQILVVPIAYSELSKIRRKMLRYMIFALCVNYYIRLYQQYNTVNSEYNNVIPFNFFFE